MKKTYSKPEIMFESFTMSTSIAAGCDDKVTTYAADQCGIPWEGSVENIFLVGISGCKKQYEADGWGGICYHNPSDTTNLFNS